jgi:hypothetical protein
MVTVSTSEFDRLTLTKRYRALNKKIVFNRLAFLWTARQCDFTGSVNGK